MCTASDSESYVCSVQRQYVDLTTIDGLYVRLCYVYMRIDDGGMTSITKTGTTPVGAAAYYGHLDVVKFLVLEANADPDKPNKVWSRA